MRGSICDFPSSSRMRGSIPIPVILANAGIHLRIPIVRQYSRSKNLLMLKQPAVYILASQPRGTLYVGVSSNLIQRIWQHKSGVMEGFTERYEVDRLVYFEMHTDMTGAITREKQLKKWKRDWKIALIEKDNPDWRDLWPEIVG
jgi:putative endonuclease